MSVASQELGRDGPHAILFRFSYQVACRVRPVDEFPLQTAKIAASLGGN
jgi:hypothetical protein